MRGKWLLAAGALLAAMLVAACGGGGDGTDSDDFREVTPGAEELPPDEIGEFGAVVPVTELVAGEDTRFVFALVNQDNRLIAFGDTTVRFFSLEDPEDPQPRGEAVARYRAVEEEGLHTHPEGAPAHTHDPSEARGLYTVDWNFPTPGQWGAEIVVRTEDGDEHVTRVGFNVLAEALTPGVGELAPKSDNLTRFDVEDISLIDSGEPPNDMHDVKIRDAIEQGRPLLVVFSTPKFCLSRFCGPLNQEVERLHDRYRDRVDFVHIEIWRDYDNNIGNETALEWLQQPDGQLIEPRVFLVDKNGRIFHRWENMVTAEEMEPWLERLAAGETAEPAG